MAFSFNKPAATPSFSFGAPSTSTAPKAPTFSFGQPSAGQNTTQATQSSTTPAANPFSQPAPSGNLFGTPAPTTISTATNPYAPKPAFSFGQSNAPAAPTNTFGQSSLNFGAPKFGQTVPSGPLVASTSQAPQAPQPQNLNMSTSGGLLGGNSNTSNFASSSFASQLNASTNLTNTRDISSALMAIKEAWSSESPSCAFQTYFYNAVEQPGAFARPPRANEVVWNKALRSNPKPQQLVPVLAVGFDDLKKRTDVQTRSAQAHAQRLEEIGQRANQLYSASSLNTAPRLQRAQILNQQLTHRLLSMVAKLHRLLPRTSLREDEDRLHAQLANLQKEVDDARLRTRVAEIRAQIEQRKRGGAMNGHASADWSRVDDKAMHELVHLLSQHEVGLKYLIDRCRQSAGEMDVMRREFGLTSVHTTAQGVIWDLNQA